MKVYLVDAYKIYTYSLPNKVEDAFIINYVHYSGEEETITFVAFNNQWIIESSPDIRFQINGKTVEKDFLKNDAIYNIQFSDLTDIVTLYCFDAHQTYFDYDIPGNKTEIIVGKGANCDIFYNQIDIAALQLKFYKQNGMWILEDNVSNQTKVYHNGKRVRNAILSMGDIIFTNGLKIIWMEVFIKINNPNNLIRTSLPAHVTYADKNGENIYTPVKDTERSVVLYNDNQVFFHTPRMKEDIVDKEITIERPPQKTSDEELPLILNIGTTAIMGVSSMLTGFVAIGKVTSGKATISEVLPELMLCVVMVIGSIILPVIIDRYMRRIRRKKEKNRKKVYREYLESIKTTITKEIEKEKNILENTYFNSEQIKNFINDRSNKLWSREITDNDFLKIRLGIGNHKPAIELKISEMAYDIEKDELNIEAQTLSEQKLLLEQVPITISFIDNSILPIVIAQDYQYRREFVNFILLQLISYYSGNDLKIVIFTTTDNYNQWNFLKYLPHCANETRNTRFFAETEEEAKQLSSYLEKIYQVRWNSINQKSDEGEVSTNQEPINIENEKEVYKNFDTYYLIITDNYVTAKRYGIIQKLLNHSTNVGFSLLTIEHTMQNVPSKCNNIVQVNQQLAGIVNKILNENDNQNVFKPDLFMEDIRSYANIIGNIPLAIESTAGKLPKSLSFLEMYKVGKIEQLNILNRWTKNDPTNSISTPIGVHEDGKLFELDLHEKAHGPHGLIAGSTGSGKSEFIITFILSMAINYHPYEVQFVLIDYKGGGLAGAFENKETGIRLPHLAGTITNLDISEMNRTLVSINSELKRRQRMFNEARDALNESTVDIYKYQKFYRDGKVKEPMSHLFIISDEFAELKAQQPEFMDALVSTARIGRSLGVHLILATQKPSGVVDDQIWSNSRFKICLKVATAEDSRELLRRSEAAEIKETGRFYLQVGFNELFELGQSGWSGAKYNPTDHIVKSIDDDIDIIDNNGNIIKAINDEKVENQENHGEQLTNIVRALCNLAEKEKIKNQSMWLPSLPTEIYLSQLIEKYHYKAKPYYMEPLIGEYDDPEKQFQGEYKIDFSGNGNLLIYGLAGSGKENIIMTIIYSLCIYHTSKEINIYILDFGAEILKIFKDMPQVGDVALLDDKDKVKSILAMLDREIIRRKELFSEYGGNYIDYINNSGKKLPTIFIVLNGWESFAESYNSYVDVVGHLLRECTKYGIIFITSMVTTNGMIGTMQQNFNNRIALQLADSFDYKFLLDAPSGLIPKKAFSRGLCIINDEIFEFQGAYIYLKDQINEAVKTTMDKYSKEQKKAPPIPIIPSNVSADSMVPYISNLASVPVGIDIHDASVFSLNLIENRIIQMVGNYIITEKDFLFELIKVLNLLQDTKLKVIDFAGAIDEPDEIEDYMGDEFTKAIQSIIENEKNEAKQMIYVLIGIGRIYDKVLDEGIETLFKIFNSINNFKKSSFIIIDNYSIFRKTMEEDWYKKLVNKNVGIWVGSDIESQNAIVCKDITKGDSNEEFSGIVYATDGKHYGVLKGIGAKTEEEY